MHKSHYSKREIFLWVITAVLTGIFIDVGVSHGALFGLLLMDLYHRTNH